MVERWKLIYPAKEGDEERNAYLYLPRAYETEPDRRFPVLYMFDGHNLFFDSDATFGKSWGLAEYLDRTGAELIVAAIECNHAPDHGRLKEYTPWPFENPSYGAIENRGQQTMDWFIRTFKPEIDGRCRTLPDREHTFIAGSSMGGLMSLYAVTACNDVFSRAAALSPSLWVDKRSLLALIGAADLKNDTVVYMDYGSKELKNKAARANFEAVSAALMERKVFLTARIVPQGDHSERSWEKQLPFAIPALLYES